MSLAAPSEARVRGVRWDALRGLAPELDLPLAAVLSGEAADAVLAAFLRARPALPGPARAAVAEAVLGVGLWRRRLLAQRGDEAEALADALDRPGPVFLRANLLRTSRDELAARLRGEGVATRPGALARGCLEVTSPRPNVLGLAAHRAGLFEVQDEGSQLLGEAVGALAGESLLDACAGAGGKTLLLAAAVGAAGRVHTADPDAERLARLRRRAARAGAAGIVAVHGAEAPEGLVVDRVLVDAPCSELGALRRGPDLRWRIDPGAFAPLPALQLAILTRAARHLRPGGSLVYATCTFRREEDEDVALALEVEHPELARVAPAAPAEVLTPDGFLRTWPHRHGTDAFFAAAWRVRE